MPDLFTIDIFCLGAEDIKTHMDEFQDAMTLGQRLTDQDIVELQILIEQAVHEIKHLRPQVTFYTWQQSKHCIDIANFETIKCMPLFVNFYRLR